MIAIGRRTTGRLSDGLPGPAAREVAMHRRPIPPGVARSPVGALGSTRAWLRRAGRIMAANQRLLFFPIAFQVGVALLALPVTLASHDTVTFDVYARDAADGDARVVDLLGASSTSTTTIVVIAATFVAAVLSRRG